MADDKQHGAFAQARSRGLWTLGFLRYCLTRFSRHGGTNAAAALTFTTLLAFVPFLTISLAIFSAFDAFAGVRGQIQDLLFGALVPEAATVISDYLTAFIDNASKMTGPGLLGLAVTAVLLLNTIDRAFNATFRVTEPRSLALRVLVYWALLTIGPLLIGASLTLSTYAFAAVQWAGMADYAGPLSGLSKLVTFLLSALAFTLLFLIVPNRTVRVREATSGAVAAALLFELLKAGFGLYLRHFPSYQAIYGALAGLPIFLLWMYLSWAVLLFGAEIAAALPEWQAVAKRGARRPEPGARLALALAILLRLREASRRGEILREKALARGLPVTPSELDLVLGSLKRHRYVAQSGSGRWVLSRDLESVTLDDLMGHLGLSLIPGGGWPERVVEALGSLGAAYGEAGGRSLAELLDETPAESPLRIGRSA